jgi:predicted nucleotidyltransferase
MSICSIESGPEPEEYEYMTDANVTTNTLTATRAFAERVGHAYPTQKAILFGSRARGSSHDESDADVAIILKGAVGSFIKTKMAMNDIAYDILLDTGIRIQPLPVWEAEWAHPESYSNPHLLHNIARDGITL